MGGYELNSGNWIHGTSGRRGNWIRRISGRSVPSGDEGIVAALAGSGLKDDVYRMHSLNLGNSRVAAVDSGKYNIEIARGGNDLGGGKLLGKREDYKNDEGKSLGSLNTNSTLGDGRNVAWYTSVLGTLEGSGGKHALCPGWMKVSYSKMIEGKGRVD